MEAGADAALEVHPASPDRWDDLVALFTRRGPRGGTPITDGCWCMFWRQRTGDAERNRQGLAAVVEAGREPGLLGYRDGVPVGWVSVGPREELGQLLRSRSYAPVDSDAGVFSIVCFYVHSSAKRCGVASTLLTHAIAYARERGARWVEAYAGSPGDYMGWPGLFAEAGFTQVRPAGKRTVMRLALDA